MGQKQIGGFIQQLRKEKGLTQKELGFLRVKVPNSPGSGKDIAEGKGVHREVESEGSRMWGKILTSWANLWSDEQKPHTRLRMRVRLHNKSKPNKSG